MGLFKSKAEKELDTIIQNIQVNMSNNYKDEAQENLKKLEVTLSALCGDKKIKDKEKDYYVKQMDYYKQKMKGYSHKDQKPFWT